MLRGTAEEEFCDVIMRFCRWGPKVFCMFVLSCTRLMLSLGKITWIIQYDDETRKVYSGSDGYQPGKTTEKDYDRNTAIGTLKLIQALGFDIVKKR